MKQRKNHGLWAVQQAFAVARERKTAYWWRSEQELDLARRISRWLYTPPTYAQIIVRCANRYIRRYVGRMVTVAEWNELCKVIADRAGYDHWKTLDACLIRGSSWRLYMQHQKTHFDKWSERQLSVPYPRVMGLHARYERMKAAAVLRQKLQEAANRKQQDKIWREIEAARQAIADINASIKAAKAALRKGLVSA